MSNHHQINFKTTMNILISRAPYSYRVDEAVPGFEDTGPVTVMDGECALCSTGARLIARLDKPGEFRVCRAQSELGAALLRHYGLDPDGPENWLYIVDGRAYPSLDGIIRAWTGPRRAGGALHPP